MYAHKMDFEAVGTIGIKFTCKWQNISKCLRIRIKLFAFIPIVWNSKIIWNCLNIGIFSPDFTKEWISVWQNATEQIVGVSTWFRVSLNRFNLCKTRRNARMCHSVTVEWTEFEYELIIYLLKLLNAHAWVCFREKKAPCWNFVQFARWADYS